jgi:formate hydrogenlyase subunit 6/NADH:ubiquinone oxidoreductase subunit I
MKQLFQKPFTNKFPVKYAPKNVTALLQKVEKQEVKIIPPVALPEGFRGKLVYEKEKCTGCKLCIRVCPAKAIEFKEDEKKIRIYMGRCVFCSQCNDVCPVQCLHMSKEFLLADTNRLSENLIVE